MNKTDRIADELPTQPPPNIDIESGKMMAESEGAHAPHLSTSLQIFSRESFDLWLSRSRLRPSPQ
jgi:hypothetical protein